jgi:hypothetical protein
VRGVEPIHDRAEGNRPAALEPGDEVHDAQGRERIG